MEENVMQEAQEVQEILAVQETGKSQEIKKHQEAEKAQNTGKSQEMQVQQAAGEECLSKILSADCSMHASQYSPLVLAYIGDAVYELVIRSCIVSEANMQVNKMHKKTTQFVKAEAQAKMIMAMESVLTPQEHAIYKRGRNAKAATMAKNASMKDYRMATGFEALIGYLYLNREFSRMMELIETGLAAVDFQE